jgi:hypothetical protein
MGIPPTYTTIYNSLSSTYITEVHLILFLFVNLYHFKNEVSYIDYLDADVIMVEPFEYNEDKAHFITQLVLHTRV